MIIRNGFIFTESCNFEKKDLYIENHKIVQSEIYLSNRTEIDAEGQFVIPGFIDIHIHGSVGHDFCDNDSEGLKAIARYLKQNGITSFCPTSMTLEKNELINIFKTATITLGDDCSHIAGINMEGPFISKDKKGAQNGKFIVSPDIAFFNELNEACNYIIKLVTIAPETEKSEEFIKELKDKVSISIGHTVADYNTTIKALKSGANHITHLYNAMPPFHHRNPGVIGAAFDKPNTTVELICDGQHIHPSIIRSTFRLFGDDCVILVSDSMMATSMPDGVYSLGGQTVFTKGKRAELADGTIAASVTNLFECFKNAVSFGIPLTSALKAVTVNPAKCIGIFDKVGSLSSGKEADIVILDKNLNIRKII